jgi:IS5 family transposase
MKQLTLAIARFEKHAKPTRRAQFLAEMERVVPWPGLCGLIAPVYSKGEAGRPRWGWADVADLLPAAVVQLV